MTKKHLFKTAAVLIALMTAFTFAGCGKKKMADVNSIDVTQATVSKETSSLASKELTKTGIVTFDYTDENGNTVRLEGKAIAGENGEATIEVVDADGNKAVFTGKASSIDGKLTVSDIKVKEAGTLVKNDGTQIEVTTDATVADASETNGENNSDIVASEDVKKDDETKETIKNENNNSGNTEANNTHVHVWGEKTEVVHHDEQGHWENVQVGTQTVVDREAYDETVYNDTPIYICECGKTFNNSYAFDYHQNNVVDLDGDWGLCAYFVNPSYHPTASDVNFKFYYEAGTYVIGSVHHEAVTHEEPVYESRYVVDSTAYDETVTTTYCTECGAVK